MKEYLDLECEDYVVLKVYEKHKNLVIDINSGIGKNARVELNPTDRNTLRIYLNSLERMT
jgi:hypothetical protein